MAPKESKSSISICLKLEPKYPPEEVVAKFQFYHNHFVQNNATPLYVLEGQQNPMKKETLLNRYADKARAESVLESLLAKAREGSTVTDADRKSFQQSMIEATGPCEEIVALLVAYMTENGIKFEQAPYEAESQLIQLERKGFVDALYIEDGDAIILGAQCAYVQIHFHPETDKQSCVRYDRARVVGNSKYPLGMIPEECWFYLPGFLGCDYSQNIPGYRYKKVQRHLWPQFLDAEDKSKYLSELAKRFQLKEQWLTRFWHATGLYQYPPVYDHDSNKIVPLNSIPYGVWSKLIGFDPLDLLPISAIHHRLAANIDGFSFAYGRAPRAVKAPTYRLVMDSGNPYHIDPETPLLRCALIDFDRFPIPLLPDVVLKKYCNAREVFFDNRKDSRSFKERTVKLLHENKNPVLPPSLVIEDIKWFGFEALKVDDTSAWTSQYWSTIKALPWITSDDIDKFYPKGNEQNQVQATQHLDGGNYLVSSIRAMEVTAKKDNAAMILLQCQCVPSMCSEVESANLPDNHNGRKSKKKKKKKKHPRHKAHTVFLCFEKVGRVKGFPYTCCGCEKGRVFCSHCLGFLLLCRLIQDESDGQQVFEACMPESPLLIQNLPLPIENMARKEPLTHRLAQKKRYSNA